MTFHFASHRAYTGAVEVVAADPIGRDDLGALMKLATGGLYPVERSVALADVRRHRQTLQTEYSKPKARQAYQLQRRGIRVNTRGRDA